MQSPARTMRLAEKQSETRTTEPPPAAGITFQCLRATYPVTRLFMRGRLFLQPVTRLSTPAAKTTLPSNSD